MGQHFFEKVHGLLRDGGRFMLVTLVHDSSLMSRFMNLLFVATRGLYPLPGVLELRDDLAAAGFGRMKEVRLPGMSGGVGLIACR